MIIKDIYIHELEMELKHPFQTNYGVTKKKKIIITEIIDECGNQGWGEGCAFEIPWYTEETHHSSLFVIEKFLVPLILGKDIKHPEEITTIFSVIKRNNMAKAAIETAIWDLYAKRNKMTLVQALGGSEKEIQVGISIGIQKDIPILLHTIQKAMDDGYYRFKLKLEKGKEIEVLKIVREHYPMIPLMLDMNSAYGLDEMEYLKLLDEFNLIMLEQPLGDNDFLDHAELQKELNTPICLDESIHTLEDTKVAIAIASCKIINIKLSRVGGHTIAKQIHDLCKVNNIPVWSGGMLETGIGRAHNMALSTLSNFTIPGDISSFNRYWHEDITVEPILMEKGIMKIKETFGIGYEVDRNKLRKYRLNKLSFIS